MLADNTHDKRKNSARAVSEPSPMRKWLTMIRTLFFLAILLPSPVTGSPDTFFTKLHLIVDGSQIDYVVEDLNNDGLKDLLFFHLMKTGDGESRFFSIFYQTPTGFFATADQCFEVDKDAVVYCVSDVVPSPGKEIVFAKSEGLFYYAAVSGHFEPSPRLLIETDSVFKLPDRSFLEHYPFLRDLDDDGIDEILVPQFDRFAVYHQDTRGRYTQKTTLDTPMQATILSGREVSKYIVSSYSIPNIVVADYNADGKKDVIFIQETHLTVFFQTDDRTLSNDASATIELGETLSQTFALQIRNLNIYKRDRFKDKTGIKALEDLNGDGLMDVIVETFSISKTVFNPKKTMKIFFGRPNADTPSKGAVFASEPDNTIVTTGFPGRSTTIDLDGDKNKELLIPSVELGFFKIIRILLSGRADVNVYIYKCNENGRYNQESDDEINFTVDIDKKGRRVPVASFRGDFNGDGKTDHLGARNDAIVIVFNPNDGSLKTTPDVTFPVRIPDNGMKVASHQITNDPFSDVVIVYADASNEPLPGEKNVCLLINNNGNTLTE